MSRCPGAPKGRKSETERAAAEAVEAERLAGETESREDRALREIRDNPKITQRALADALRCPKTSAHRLIQDLLTEKKWVKRVGRTLVLTRGGEAVLDG